MLRNAGMTMLTNAGQIEPMNVVTLEGGSSLTLTGANTLAGVVFDTGSPALIEDLPGSEGAQRHGVRSSASVAIADADGRIGVLNVGSRDFPARLTDMYLRAADELLTSENLVLVQHPQEPGRRRSDPSERPSACSYPSWLRTTNHRSKA